MLGDLPPIVTELTLDEPLRPPPLFTLMVEVADRLATKCGVGVEFTFGRGLREPLFEDPVDPTHGVHGTRDPSRPVGRKGAWTA